MDAKTNLKHRLPNRHVTEGLARAPRRLQPQAVITEVFKKTPEIADLDPSGRYLVTDLVDTGAVPHLVKAFSDRAVRPLSKSIEKISYADQ
jgi:dihydroxyacid dehydratase/phosphogluconate dehydratase